MAHVELSLTDAPPRPRGPAESSISRWAAAVTDADEPCLLLDLSACIVAVSPTGADLLGLGDSAACRGRSLREAANPLVDFTAAQGPLDEVEISRIPPLLAISSGRLARGLVRTRCRTSGQVTTMDAVATPLTDGARVVGSLTFIAAI